MRETVLAMLMAAMAVSDSEEEIWVFFSPDSPDASRIFEQLRGHAVRPALIVERYFGRAAPAADFLSTLRVAGEVRVVDEEALREAERLGIRELPAVAVRRGGRVHVASGSRVDLKELLQCVK